MLINYEKWTVRRMIDKALSIERPKDKTTNKDFDFSGLEIGQHPGNAQNLAGKK